MSIARLLAVSCFPLLVLSAQDIRITSGLSDQQVLQRNADQVAGVKLAGTTSAKKAAGKIIEVRVSLSGGKALSGFDWIPAGKVARQSWTAELDGIPTGGPYRLEVRLQGSAAVASVDDFLVGDLWILAGQSNMEGIGDLVDVQPPDPRVHSFDMADRWLIAEEPLHTLVNAADPVHWRVNAQKVPERWTGEKLRRYQQERRKGAGLGLPFAIAMVQRTGIPIGLIPCAHGGTSMDQWDPALKDRDGESLYGSMLRRFRAVGGHIKGVLWYQGESDANAQAAPVFQQKFENFVKTLRADAGAADLPFYYVQIGRHINGSNVGDWNLVQEAQRKAELNIPHSGMVASIDSSLDDIIHVDTEDLKRLGARLADLACHDLFPRIGEYGELKRGPRPVSAHYADGVVRVTFSGVNGGLQTKGRIAGFSIHNASGEPIPLIYRARIDPAEASVVLLYVSQKPPDKAALRYGYGKDPICNVGDAAGFDAPVFGPLVIQ
jgi:sialate O-acetylesterase